MQSVGACEPGLVFRHTELPSRPATCLYILCFHSDSSRVLGAAFSKHSVGDSDSLVERRPFDVSDSIGVYTSEHRLWVAGAGKLGLVVFYT